MNKILGSIDMVSCHTAKPLYIFETNILDIPKCQCHLVCCHLF